MRVRGSVRGRCEGRLGLPSGGGRTPAVAHVAPRHVELLDQAVRVHQRFRKDECVWKRCSTGIRGAR